MTDKTTTPEVHVDVTRYEVSVLPAGDINRRYFTLYVESRGGGKWAVTNGFRECVGRDGIWSHDSLPSERADEWLAAHRFDLDTALQLAKQVAPNITVNGHTAINALAQEQESSR